MRRFGEDQAANPHDYRLNPGIFYLKFVKRDGALGKGSIIVPLDQFEKLRHERAFRGPRNGVRVSYESLSGRYLRQGAFLSLLQSGYIGAHAETTVHFKFLVEQVLKNDKGVVAAIQSASAGARGTS